MAQAQHQLILAVLFFGVAQAAPLAPEKIAGMVAQNDAVMAGGVCFVANREEASARATELILLGGKAFRVSSREVDAVRSVDYEKNPRTGRYRMSEAIEKACRKDEATGGCIYARSRWQTVPPSVSPPGRGAIAR